MKSRVDSEKKDLEKGLSVVEKLRPQMVGSTESSGVRKDKDTSLKS